MLVFVRSRSEVKTVVLNIFNWHDSSVVVRHNLLQIWHFGRCCATRSNLRNRRVLRAHGTPTTSLHDIFRATILSRIQYAAPAWSGMCSAADRSRLESLLRRAKRLGTAQTTCRPSPTYSTLLMMTFFMASKPTLTTFCSLIYLARLTYLTGFAPALTI